MIFYQTKQYKRKRQNETKNETNEMKGQNCKWKCLTEAKKKKVGKIGRGEQQALKLNVRIYANAAFKQRLVEI